MDLKTPRMRPQFDVHIDAPERVLPALQRVVDETDRGYRLQLMRNFGDLRVPSDDEHFFSPTLLVAVESADGTDFLRCRFTPSPNVWTGFMATYGVLVLAATAGLMYGVSQWLLDRPPWALLGFPAALALIGFVYGAAFIGQGLGGEQMYRLRHQLEKALDNVRAAPSDSADSAVDA